MKTPKAYPAAAIRVLGQDVVRPRLRIARLARHVSRPVAAGLILVNLALGVLPVTFTILISVLIGRLPALAAAPHGAGRLGGVVTEFAAAALVFAAAQALTPVQTAAGELMARQIDGAIHDRLMRASLRSDGIGPLEDQAVRNELGEAVHDLEFGFQSPGTACAGLLNLIARYVQLTGFAILIAWYYAPFASLALVAATMAFRTGQRGGLRRYSQVTRTVAGPRREVRYLREVALGPVAAKEIRVFGLAGWLASRYQDATMRAVTPVWRARRRIYLTPYLGFTAAGLTVAATVLALYAHSAATGGATLTGLVMVVQATMGMLRLGAFYPEADTQTQFGINSFDAVLRFERAASGFEAAAATPATSPAAGPAPPAPREHIRFDNVSFRYPHSQRAVFSGLDLTLPAGKCTAVVGVNGAGKTTLVKLLARLHEPDGGAVLADGHDIRGYPVAQWRRHIAVIFQDFIQYELSAADNIGVGAAWRTDPGAPAAIRSAAEAAGILPVLRALPLGLDSPLSRQYPGGAGLSGGQWQKVALARALYALDSGASVIVLDEPTAALDVRAERDFFERFNELTAGHTTLLISHRFSSVRNADHIAVLDGGRLAEEGTHAGLLAENGQYARLFALQAERFEAAS